MTKSRDICPRKWNLHVITQTEQTTEKTTITTINMDNHNNYFLLLIFMITIALILKSKARLKLPPGPYAWPVIGNILAVDSQNAHIWLADLAHQYGPLISLKLGPNVLVVASSPAAAKEILKTRDGDLSGRFRSCLAASLPELQTSSIVLSSECTKSWRFLRRISHTEVFSPAALEVHAKLRAMKAQELLDFLASKKDGQVVEIVNVVYTTFVNMLTNSLMSRDLIESLDCAVDDLKAFSRELIGFVVPGMADMYSPMGTVLGSGTKNTAIAFKERSREIWYGAVKERRNSGKKMNDFLDVLINSSVEDDHIHYLFSEFFVTSDSVSTTMEWAIAELTRNEAVLSRLQAEINEAIGDTAMPTLSEMKLANLPYLQACIKETLRLHPPSPFLVPHCALQACKLMNYDIPKNSLIAVNIYAIGRDPKTWEDPLSFRPERFLGENNINVDLKGTHYELLPFGGGRRMCIGVPLVLKQIQLLLALLVHGFDWVLPSGANPAKLDMSDKFSIPLRRAKPLLLILNQRNHLKIQ